MVFADLIYGGRGGVKISNLMGIFRFPKLFTHACLPAAALAAAFLAAIALAALGRRPRRERERYHGEAVGHG